MARFRRRFRNIRRYGVRSSARWAWGRASSRQKTVISKWLPFGAGVAAGYFAPKVLPYQDEIALMVCAAPVKMPKPVRGAASGYVWGRIIRNILAGGLNSGTANNSGLY